jgi:hypothetical protein
LTAGLPPTATPGSGGILAVLVFGEGPEREGEECQNVMFSILDSLVIGGDTGAPTVGPVTTFAYPPTRPVTKEVQLGDTRVRVTLDGEEGEAAQSVVDREFAVLSAYGGSPLYQAAWERYYRRVYADSRARLGAAADAILDGINASEESTLRSLLAWVQSFPYARDFRWSDFTALPSILAGDGSDCDSRAMLLAVILERMGVRGLLLVSPVYKHALFGAAVDLPGQTWAGPDGTVYLLCETTAPVPPGTVPQEAADKGAWFPVSLN